MKKLHIFGIFFSLLALLTCCAFLLLPHLCDTYLLPRVIKELPFSEKEISISKISPWKARATVTLADKGKDAFSIPRLEILYSPTSLLKGTIDTLLIDSASFHVEMIDGIPALRGTTTRPKTRNQQIALPALILPFSIDTIVVKNCTLTFYSTGSETVNFIANSRLILKFADQGSNQKRLTEISGDLFTRGDLAVSGTTKINNFGKNQEVLFQLEAPNVGQLVGLFPQLKELMVTGRAAVTGKVRFEQLTQLKNFDINVAFSNFRASAANVVIGNRSEEIPIALRLTGNQDELEYSLEGINIAAPEQSTLDIMGTLNIPDHSFYGNGELMVERIQSPLNVNYSGSQTEQNIHFKYKIQSEPFQLLDRFSFTPVDADGNVTFDGTEFSADVNLQVTKVTDSMSHSSLLNTSLHIPISYPISPGSAAPAWLFSVEKVYHQGINSGQFQASLTPTAQDIAVSSLFTSPFGPNIKLSCNGSLGWLPKASLTCTLPPTAIDSSAMPPYIPSPEDLKFSGQINAKGIFSFNKMQPSGSVTLSLKNGVISNQDNTISDIKFQVNLPNLPLIESSPSQVCTIGSLEFGTIAMTNGRIYFRIEDTGSLFLEKVRLNWCEGNVETGSFRLSKALKELETTLYCDRLNFTKLLDQFGIKNTEGEGSLNGRLPIFLSDNSIQFDDGFLFSTPGNSGIVRFNNTDQLRDGLPGMDQAAYLDYSMKAMENFSYNWTKLSFNSQNEELLITMQLDGKPAEPLPYGYQNGHIVPSKAGPGLQHPIRLDVNFRLPLQNMFRYGKNIHSLMENM